MWWIKWIEMTVKWSELNWDEVKWSEVKLREEKWSESWVEVKWSEVNWNEVKYNKWKKKIRFSYFLIVSIISSTWYIRFFDFFCLVGIQPYLEYYSDCKQTGSWNLQIS